MHLARAYSPQEREELSKGKRAGSCKPTSQIHMWSTRQIPFGNDHQEGSLKPTSQDRHVGHPVRKLRVGERERPSLVETAFLVHAGFGEVDQAPAGLGFLGSNLAIWTFSARPSLREEPDAVVVDVELVPGEAVARADGVGVVVVVPAFAAGEQSDPPVVAGVVLGFEAARAPEVGGGVDEPGGVQADDDAEEGSPEHHADGADDAVAGGASGGADGDLEEAGDGRGKPVVLGEPDVDLVAGEVGGVAAEQRGLGVQGAAGEDPAGVCPPGAVVRGVRIAFVVGVLMMDAVGGDPEDGSALKRHGAAGGDEVLDPLGGAVAAMREQAVVGHADADVDGEEVDDGEGGDVLPGEEEEGGDGADVEGAHEDGGDPVDAALLVLAAHAEVLLDLAGDFGDVRSDWTASGAVGVVDGCGGWCWTCPVRWMTQEESVGVMSVWPLGHLVNVFDCSLINASRDWRGGGVRVL